MPGASGKGLGHPCLAKAQRVLYNGGYAGYRNGIWSDSLWGGMEVNMDSKLIVALAIPILLELTLRTVALWDLAHRARVRYLPKWAWALIVLCISLIGWVAYLAIGREE